MPRRRRGARVSLSGSRTLANLTHMRMPDTGDVLCMHAFRRRMPVPYRSTSMRAVTSYLRQPGLEARVRRQRPRSSRHIRRESCLPREEAAMRERRTGKPLDGGRESLRLSRFVPTGPALACFAVGCDGSSHVTSDASGPLDSADAQPGLDDAGLRDRDSGADASIASGRDLLQPGRICERLAMLQCERQCCAHHERRSRCRPLEPRDLQPGRLLPSCCIRRH